MNCIESGGLHRTYVYEVLLGTTQYIVNSSSDKIRDLSIANFTFIANYIQKY